MTKYAAEGYSFVGRVKTVKRKAVPITRVQATAPQAAAAAGVAGASPFAVRITPTGDLYVGRLGNLPTGPVSAAPARPAGPQAAAAGAANGEPPSINATQAHRKLLAGNIVGRDDRYEIDMHTYPYTAVGFVASGCSGSMVGPRTVLTAGGGKLFGVAVAAHAQRVQPALQKITTALF
jgi:V8-like Glu-specific endopeptidase